VSESPEELQRLAGDPSFSEDRALALLKTSDLLPAIIEALAKNTAVMKHRKVIAAVVAHPRAPRHVVFPALRQLFTFELMQVALSPAVNADVRRAAEDTLINRLEKISLGERMTLARRASGRVAGALLLDPDAKPVAAALENPFLTEAMTAAALASHKASQALIDQVCHHPRWCHSRDIQLALLRNGNLSLARALEIARRVPGGILREVLADSALPPEVKWYLLEASHDDQQ
jgi:hypothetical protein